MSDSFADLWATTGGTTSNSKQTLAQAKAATSSSSSLLSSASPQPGAQPRRAYDAFSILSATSSAPSSRPLTPAGLASKSPQPQAQSKTVATGGGDAFGDLFSTAAGGVTANTTKMTIAERAKHAEQQRFNSYNSSLSLFNSGGTAGAGGGDAWAGLDMLGSSAGKPASKPATTTKAEDWGLDDFATPVPAAPQATRAPPKQAPAVDDDWGLGDFGSAPAASTSSPRAAAPTQKAKNSLFDHDDDGWGSPSQNTNGAGNTNAGGEKDLWDMSPVQPTFSGTKSQAKSRASPSQRGAAAATRKARLDDDGWGDADGEGEGGRGLLGGDEDEWEEMVYVPSCLSVFSRTYLKYVYPPSRLHPLVPAPNNLLPPADPPPPRPPTLSASSSRWALAPSRRAQPS